MKILEGPPKQLRLEGSQCARSWCEHWLGRSPFRIHAGHGNGSMFGEEGNKDTRYLIEQTSGAIH